MEFTDVSETMPGYTRYEAEDETGFYVIQRKGENAQWRLAKRDSPAEPLRIIYLAGDLAEAQAYAEEYRSRLQP